MIENMQEYVRHIRAAVSDRLDLTREVEDDEIREVISQIVAEESRQNYLSLGERQTVIETVFNSMRGLDVLQPLVDDPSITEIMINGPHHVFIEQNGRLYQKNVSFGSNDNLLNVILNIVSKVNRTVNEANPIVDARLLDGSRVNVVLPPIALDGPTVTIRKFPEDPMIRIVTIHESVRIGFLFRTLAAWQIVRCTATVLDTWIDGQTLFGGSTLRRNLTICAQKFCDVISCRRFKPFGASR